MPLPEQTYNELLTNMRILLSGDLSRLDKTLRLLPQHVTVAGLSRNLIMVTLQLRAAVTSLDNLIALLQLDATPTPPPN